MPMAFFREVLGDTFRRSPRRHAPRLRAAHAQGERALVRMADTKRVIETLRIPMGRRRIRMSWGRSQPACTLFFAFFFGGGGGLGFSLEGSPVFLRFEARATRGAGACMRGRGVVGQTDGWAIGRARRGAVSSLACPSSPFVLRTSVASMGRRQSRIRRLLFSLLQDLDRRGASCGRAEGAFVGGVAWHRMVLPFRGCAGVVFDVPMVSFILSLSSEVGSKLAHGEAEELRRPDPCPACAGTVESRRGGGIVFDVLVVSVPPLSFPSSPTTILR
ncbi:hypothetical protein C8J57DRAFT_418393 [Mycena rebaudengoi]|nr:hypothetical protein C8J57DRAFT_418393 [Mycena rebaudengoi]